MNDTTFEIEYAHGVDVSDPKPPLTKVQKYVLYTFVFLFFILNIYLFNKYQSASFISLVPELAILFVVYSVITYEYTPPSSLLLEPRFMVCANQVLYYTLIDRILVLDGQLELYSENKLVFVLDRAKFKSVSTKPAKKKANQQRRFDAVLKELLPRIEHYNPGVLIER